MTTQELDALERLCEAATALMGDGWEYDEDSLMVYFSAGYINTRQPIAAMRGGTFLMQYSGDTWDKVLPQLHNNGRFIAAARTALPALIAEVRRLQSDNAFLRKAYREKAALNRLIASSQEIAANDAEGPYKDYYDRVTALPDCNTCGRHNCEYRPVWGCSVRINCPLWVKPTKEAPQ